MTSDGGYWPRSGRHRPDAGAYDREDGYEDQHGYNGHDEAYQDSGSYRRPAWHDPQAGYGSTDGYTDPYGYAENGGYADPGYGGGAGYADPQGYGGQAGYGTESYGDQGGYAGHGGYGADGGYAESGNYGDQGGYGGSGYSQAGYAEPGYGDQAGYQAPDSYGGDAGGGYGPGPASRGRHSAGSRPDLAGPAGQDPYGASGYGHDPGDSQYGADQYRTEAGYGSADPYGTGSFSSYGHEELGRDHDATSSYQWQDQYGQTDPLTGSFRADDTGSYDAADTGSHSSWAFTPGSQDRQDFDASGHARPAEPFPAEPFPAEPTGGFGVDSGVFGRPDAGSSARPDAGSFGLDDSSTFGRPDTGSFGFDDSRTFSRPDTGSFRRADSGSFGPIDTGSFDRDEEFRGGSDQDADSDSGSIRWTSGPPPLRRSDRDGDDAVSGRGAPLGDPAGSAGWRDDPADGDWQDEADDGLLSRRFGRAGEPAEPEGEERVRVRGRKKRRVRGKAAVTASILVVVLVLGVAGAFGYRFVHSWISDRYGDYTGSGTGTVQITVNSGDTLAGLGPQLVNKGVIMTERPYDTAAAAAAASGTLQPGIYKLHHHMNSALAVQLLLSSKARIQIQAVIIEGMRASAIAAELAKRTGISAETFLNIIKNPPATLGLPTWAPKGVGAEGFLFPDTYYFLPHQSALSILQVMVREFDAKITSIHMVSDAKKVFTTPWHALIVASMVQAEAGALADMPKISRVAWNRLKIGKPLQFDSTVFYAMGTYGTSITAQEEKFKSPFNTYQHAGLPPGPIGNPGLDAIEAALHPVKANYLYFITDTRHKPFITHFTASLKQLQEWQRKYQG
jgi:uncharacterized YceG family protein